jgi:ATP-dependent RNA helicase DBP3
MKFITCSKKIAPPVVDNDKAVQKALKKAKKAARKEAEAAAASVDGGSKKEKKNKKRKSDAGSQDDTSTLSKKELKKQKKKEAKAAAATAATSDAPPPPDSKKSKKSKAVQETHGAPEGEMAAVGNRQLAATRPPLIKASYKENSEITQMSLSDVDTWREERRIALENCQVKPLTSFTQSGLTADELFATRTFTSPSPIQSQCLPIALSGRDLVGIAATGSGKTLAFGLPALRHVKNQLACGAASGRKPIALMIAPTRELALQIAGVLDEAGSKVGIKTVCVYGGVPKREQAQALRAGAAIVVATPGRLEDFMEEGACKLDEVSFLVLDEADRMLDLGFEPHIRKIAEGIRSDRQTLMFSATWPPAIRKLASEFLAHPARVIIGSQDLAASHSVTQIVEVVDAATRDGKLEDLLKKYHKSRKNRIIVFVLYKKEAARVETMLQRKGWKAAAVHGDISQEKRSAAVDSFKSGEIPLLVATDVAARGLDIPDVEVVINYSFPLTTEDYVHRIGRTGRAGKTGTAHTLFVAQNDKPRAGELINVLREAKQTVPDALLAFGTTVKKKESKLYGAHFKDIDHTAKATKITFDSDDE